MQGSVLKVDAWDISHFLTWHFVVAYYIVFSLAALEPCSVGTDSLSFLRKFFLHLWQLGSNAARQSAPFWRQIFSGRFDQVSKLTSFVRFGIGSFLPPLQSFLNLLAMKHRYQNRKVLPVWHDISYIASNGQIELNNLTVFTHEERTRLEQCHTWVWLLRRDPISGIHSGFIVWGDSNPYCARYQVFMLTCLLPQKAAVAGRSLSFFSKWRNKMCSLQCFVASLDLCLCTWTSMIWKAFSSDQCFSTKSPNLIIWIQM